MSMGFKRYAALSAAVLGLAVSLPLAAQTGRDAARGTSASGTDTSACSPLSGRQRESCIEQIERDDAQRGVSRTAGNRGASGISAATERCERMSGKARSDCMAESRTESRGAGIGSSQPDRSSSSKGSSR